MRRDDVYRTVILHIYQSTLQQSGWYMRPIRIQKVTGAKPTRPELLMSFFLSPGVGGFSTLGEIRAPSWRLHGLDPPPPPP